MGKEEIKQSIIDQLASVSEGELIKISQGIQQSRLDSLAADQTTPHKSRKFGGMKGLLVYMAEDFDAPLEDFAKYMR